VTLEEYEGATELLKQAKHRLAPNGRYLNNSIEIPGSEHLARYAWEFLDRAEQHLTRRLDIALRGVMEQA
jgi:hypothetical protein